MKPLFTFTFVFLCICSTFAQADSTTYNSQEDSIKRELVKQYYQLNIKSSADHLYDAGKLGIVSLSFAAVGGALSLYYSSATSGKGTIIVGSVFGAVCVGTMIACFASLIKAGKAGKIERKFQLMANGILFKF